MKVVDLLSTPDRWTQNAPARTADGRPCGPTDPRAVCWCLVAALLKCYPHGEDYLAALAKVQVVVGFSVVKYNDDDLRIHQDVLDAARLAEV